MRYTRLSNEIGDYVYATESVDEALALYAGNANYRSYADLAETLGLTVEQAKGNLVIEVISAREVIEDLIKGAIESDAVEDGAETPFCTVADWADWCLSGADGDKIRAFATLHHLDSDDLILAAREALRECDLDAINEPFAERDAA